MEEIQAQFPTGARKGMHLLIISKPVKLGPACMLWRGTSPAYLWENSCKTLNGASVADLFVEGDLYLSKVLKSYLYYFFKGTACVQDLIGLIMYKYTSEGRDPPLKVIPTRSNWNRNNFHLLMIINNQCIVSMYTSSYGWLKYVVKSKVRVYIVLRVWVGDMNML